jgi:hypothetical protein
LNSRRKGKVGEREFAALLREHGFDARRGQQFSGGSESPDVVSEALGWLHVEVKRVQNLNLTDACVQAEGDCGGKPWIVAHRRNHSPWLITMRAETFFRLLRGDFQMERSPSPQPSPPGEVEKISEVSGGTPTPARETRALPNTEQISALQQQRPATETKT